MEGGKIDANNITNGRADWRKAPNPSSLFIKLEYLHNAVITANGETFTMNVERNTWMATTSILLSAPVAAPFNAFRHGVIRSRRAFFAGIPPCQTLHPAQIWYDKEKRQGGIIMESKQDLQQALQQLADANRKQVRYARIQCFFTVAAAILCLLILLTAARIVPQVQQLAGQISSLSSQAEVVLSNLETVTEELAQSDISGMVADVDSLVDSSQTGVDQALEKINAIDIDTLNKAIENLSKIVTPLANLITRLS